MDKIIYKYASRRDVTGDAVIAALNYVYSVSYPSSDKSFSEICEELNKERISQNGDQNWRKEYKNAETGKSYCWPTDFFYIPNKILKEIWDNHKEANKANDTWKENLDFLNELLFEKPGLKEVYEPTDWSNGEKVRHCVDQKLLKDLIGEENANIVKDIINDYKFTYKFDSRDLMQFSWGFLSTPCTNREIVKEAWKTAFSKDIDIPDDSTWVDEYWEDDEE